MPNVANEDLMIEFTMTAGPPEALSAGPQEVPLSSSIVGINATKASVSGKKVVVSTITTTFVGDCPYASLATLHTFVSGAGSMSAGATKNTADTLPVFLEGDIGTCAGPTGFTNNNTGAPVPCACTLKISSAGQEKVKGI